VIERIEPIVGEPGTSAKAKGPARSPAKIQASRR
jgi:hypothetical protein